MYDIFISFKKTDENGRETEDCRIAGKLYSALAERGLDVFFSNKTLEEIGSSRYKEDIDNALDEATVMIVVLTRSEYATAHWVEYEWDSFYNDYLSGVKKNAKLFTVIKRAENGAGVSIHELPRTLRNVQSLDYSEEVDGICQYVMAALPEARLSKLKKKAVSQPEPTENDTKNRFTVLTGKELTYADIEEAVGLDKIVYPDDYWLEPGTCMEWFDVNPDIYVMIRDNQTGRIIAYINVSPVTEECYDEIRSGKYIDTFITADMILSYNMPFPYNIYFSSVVIHPDYQNTEVFLKLFNAIVEKFMALGKNEIFMKKMIADAVSKEGEKFCRMFGMTKVDSTTHSSSLYEVTLIPPKFRVSSKMTKALSDFYRQKYEEEPYLFD